MKLANLFILVSLPLFIYFLPHDKNRINRKQLVERHKIKVNKFDTLASLSVGNGKFAFTVDATGLQTFPDFYSNGIPLGTQSEWGWHSFVDTASYLFEESLKEYDANGKIIPYPVQWSEKGRNKNASDWFRQNPHRLQLGGLGFDLYKKDGSKVQLTDIKDITQVLNPWTGIITSHFTVEDESVDVETLADQKSDEIAVQVVSELIKKGQLQIRLQYPYPTGEWMDVGINWNSEDKHKTEVVQQSQHTAVILHQIDSTRYYTSCSWNNGAIKENKRHYFTITPDKSVGQFEFTCSFSPNKPSTNKLNFVDARENTIAGWKDFWSRGGAVDFSGSTDPRASELERRIILSQYLTKIQCAGAMPPQETGLTYNSWYGKPHLEMTWWHGVHFALWGRIDLLEKQLEWYRKVSPEAEEIAKRQGFKGIRWQKMTDPDGKESPSSVGSFLIWQQPHFIYFAELIHRQKNNKETLEKYKDLVFATADFMASYPYYEKEKDRYILGKGLIPAQECFDPMETFNPTYELAYWRWALSTAQSWRKKLNLPPKREWQKIVDKLSELPKKNDVYLATESTPDCYTSERYRKDHPAVMGAYGMLPRSSKLDTTIMKNTFDLVWKTWFWEDTWGWDFPMTAMTAARIGKLEKAVDALFMDVPSNTYLQNGHNYQDKRLRLYLPGNGGLLTAVAMMCAGWDGSTGTNPGFPKNGKWTVKWEGLHKIP